MVADDDEMGSKRISHEISHISRKISAHFLEIKHRAARVFVVVIVPPYS